jgi:hypothetical protein
MTILIMGSTREGELHRTAEVLIDIATKHKGNARQVVADLVHLLRSTNRTEAHDLKDLNDILDGIFDPSTRR